MAARVNGGSRASRAEQHHGFSPNTKTALIARIWPVPSVLYSRVDSRQHANNGVDSLTSFAAGVNSSTYSHVLSCLFGMRRPYRAFYASVLQWRWQTSALISTFESHIGIRRSPLFLTLCFAFRAISYT